MRDTSRTSLQENVKVAVVRWNPWNDLFDLHAQMDHLFQPLAPATASRNGVEYTGLPVDIQQTDAAFVVEASVPGFNPADVEVTFEDGVLTITGRRSTSETSKDATYLRRERRTASVFRQVGLPAEVRAEDITAAFDNGVLRVTVPRAQKAQPKRIPVTVSNGDKTEHIVEAATAATA
ncbi:MAG TPA: Hsp20/alpha crystallin family protein [Candidatus Dormibacteraeota bacterium]|jgi:HSP20 family protein|nr:Hsp20/alpha crystallin family protein [Candidatus Dormibacteraeota bacterium]